MRAAVSLLALIALAGCSNESDPDESLNDRCPPSEPIAGQAETAVLGIRKAGPEGLFQELHDGDPVPLVRGPQGGQHLEMKVRLYAESGRDWRNTFKLIRPSTGVAFGGTTNIKMEVCAPGWTDSFTNVVFVRTATDGPAIVELTTILYEDGAPIRMLSAERSCTIVDSIP